MRVSAGYLRAAATMNRDWNLMLMIQICVQAKCIPERITARVLCWGIHFSRQYRAMRCRSTHTRAAQYVLRVG